MSLLVAIFYYIGVPALIFLGARWFFRRSDTSANKSLVVVISVMIALGYAWWAVGEKMWLDHQVRVLCAKDGGIKVYETVKLPADKFNKYGNVSIPYKERAKPEDKYYLEWKITYLKKGNPSLWQSHHRLIRHSDQKLLGESIMYARSGGDLPGPWHGTSFKCPDPTQHPSLESSVFVKGDNK